MSATVFEKALDGLRAAYRGEIERLLEKYRPRILAGEFSGYDVKLDHMDGPGGLRWLRLREELEHHPWGGGDVTGRAVLTVSPWMQKKDCHIERSGVEVALYVKSGLAWEVSLCMAHDVLNLAIERGWLKPHWRRERAPYPATQPRAA